ncbi:hypothetical protein MCEGE10_01818 [Flavobacteriaceae bacterium]
MKKIILFLTIASLFLSCSGSDEGSSGNNSAGNVDYFFNININGVEHKVQGNTSGFGTGINGNVYMLNPNVCQATISTTTMVYFEIADITKPNFVSGQSLLFHLSIPNCHVGQNRAYVMISQSPLYDSFRINLPLNTGRALGFVQNSGFYNTGSNSYLDFMNYITVNITDMGTSSSSSTLPYNYGNTLKGNFTGPVYFPSTDTMAGYNCNIPMQLNISFSAYRVN